MVFHSRTKKISFHRKIEWGKKHINFNKTDFHITEQRVLTTLNFLQFFFWLFY